MEAAAAKEGESPAPQATPDKDEDHKESVKSSGPNGEGAVSKPDNICARLLLDCIYEDTLSPPDDDYAAPLSDFVDDRPISDLIGRGRDEGDESEKTASAARTKTEGEAEKGANSIAAVVSAILDPITTIKWTADLQSHRKIFPVPPAPKHIDRRDGAEKSRQFIIEYDWVHLIITHASGSVKKLSFAVGDIVCDVWKRPDGSSQEGDLHVVDKVIDDCIAKKHKIRLQKLALLEDAEGVPPDFQSSDRNGGSVEGVDRFCRTQIWQLCFSENVASLRHVKAGMISILRDAWILELEPETKEAPARHVFYTGAAVEEEAKKKELSERGFTAPDERALFRHEMTDEQRMGRPRIKARVLKPLPGCTNGMEIDKKKEEKKKEQRKKRKREKKVDEIAEAAKRKKEEEEEKEKKKQKGKKRKREKKDEDADGATKRRADESRPAKKKRKSTHARTQHDVPPAPSSSVAQTMDMLRACVNAVPTGAAPTSEQQNIITHAVLTMMTLGK